MIHTVGENVFNINTVLVIKIVKCETHLDFNDVNKFPVKLYMLKQLWL